MNAARYNDSPKRERPTKKDWPTVSLIAKRRPTMNFVDIHNPKNAYKRIMPAPVKTAQIM